MGVGGRITTPPFLKMGRIKNTVDHALGAIPAKCRAANPMSQIQYFKNKNPKPFSVF